MAKRINSFGLMVCEKNTIQVLVHNQIQQITVRLSLFKPDNGVPPSHLNWTNRYALINVLKSRRSTPRLTGDRRQRWGLYGGEGRTATARRGAGRRVE